MLEQGELTAGQARPLIGMPNASSIAEEIVAKKLSARSIEGIKKKNAKSFTIDPNIFDAQRDIERSIGLKVTINNKKNNSGKLTIEYKNLGYTSKLQNDITNLFLGEILSFIEKNNLDIEQIRNGKSK